jgi:hypothetical protein
MICVRQHAERTRLSQLWVAGSGVFRRAAAVDGTGGRVLGWEAWLASWFRI